MSLAADRAVVGVVSDTHGRLDREVVAALQGSALIVHAGDVGASEVLDALGEVAPVVAVRGNIDVEPWARRLPESELVEIGGASLYLLHDLLRLDVDPAAAGIAAVISGHTHRPEVRRQDGVLYLNPGSCGARRFDLPVTLASLTVTAAGVDGRIIDLGERAAG